MRNSIASYKESLSRIAHEVLDATDEAMENGPASTSRVSQQLSRSILPQRYPHVNGTDHTYSDEGNLDRSFIKPRRVKSHESSHSEILALESSTSRQNGFDNGSVNSAEHEKLLEEVKSLKALQSDHQVELKLLKEQLEYERANTPLLKIKLHEEQQQKDSSHQELFDLKTNIEKDKLDRYLPEFRMFQAEVSRGDSVKEQNESLESLKLTVQRLESEKLELMTEKNELEVKLNNFPTSKIEKNDADGSGFQCSSKNELIEVKMESKCSELEKVLKETCKERDKALQELSRLKQHLLDKELEDEDKMDDDSKLIEELKSMTEYQSSQILKLENALLQERTKWEELNKLKVDEFYQSNETIKGLKQKLANFMSIIDSKNVELQNLQTALGQYYAESEAKERLGRELAVAREEFAKCSELLKAANQSLEQSKKENEEINIQLTQTERMLSETKRALHKIEEDNTRLRHALERSMTTLNRMSLDSDNYVDRRIVIKLLVTYFQRNHSKEVLDLMVRMLGFSEEDKQRIGFAQHSAGKGVVRGVLGLPGRLVGGILGANTALASSRASSDHQSFADLWVDFLLKETEERERREFSEDAETHSGEQSSDRTATTVAVSSHGTRGHGGRGHLMASSSMEQLSHSSSVKQRQPSEHLDAEFSTVPLTPANSVSPSPRASNPYRHKDIS